MTWSADGSHKGVNYLEQIKRLIDSYTRMKPMTSPPNYVFQGTDSYSMQLQVVRGPHRSGITSSSSRTAIHSRMPFNSRMVGVSRSMLTSHHRPVRTRVVVRNKVQGVQNERVSQCSPKGAIMIADHDRRSTRRSTRRRRTKGGRRRCRRR